MPRPCLAAALVLTALLAGPAPAAPPAVRLSVTGPAELVLSADSMRCTAGGELDITDIPVTAFRRNDGKVIVLSGHSSGHYLIGPSVERARRAGCDSILTSLREGDPSLYRDQEWVLQLYSVDGRTVWGFVHNEYHGDTHGERGCRLSPFADRQCWLSSVTWIRSTDGGATFRRRPAPENLIITLPFRYRPGMMRAGVGMPKLVRRGEWLYMLASYGDRAVRGRGGQCLLRAPSARPERWEVWLGGRFRPVPPSPYVGEDRPGAAPCDPVLRQNVMSVKWVPGRGVFLAISISRTEVFYQTSPDMIVWSGPERLLGKHEALVGKDPAAVAAEDLPHYFSLLDPESPSRNFDTLGESFWIYYIQYRSFLGMRINERRDVFRLPVRLN
jgi:hypothetical protein